MLETIDFVSYICILYIIYERENQINVSERVLSMVDGHH